MDAQLVCMYNVGINHGTLSKVRSVLSCCLSNTNQIRSMPHNWYDFVLSLGTPTTTPFCWPADCHTCTDSSSPSGMGEVNVVIVTLQGGQCHAGSRQSQFNHFSTTGRNCGTPLRDACVRQACLPAIATSSFKIFLTQSFPRRGATCYILPWRAMSRLFNGVNIGYRSADVIEVFRLIWEF